MIVDYAELRELRGKYTEEKIVFAGGVFDLVHEGHVAGMQYCKDMGDILIVGVSSDERVRQRKGHSRPIRAEQGRMRLVDALKPVDFTFLMPLPNSVDTPTIQVVKWLSPDIFADHIENRLRWEGSRDILESLGVELVFNVTNRLDSTTDIIRRVIDSGEN